MNIGPHDWKNEVGVWPTSQLRLGHDNSVWLGVTVRWNRPNSILTVLAICLVEGIGPYLVQKKILVTSKYRYMAGVLNVDEIKN
jgi:hypothetical protein